MRITLSSRAVAVTVLHHYSCESPFTPVIKGLLRTTAGLLVALVDLGFNFVPPPSPARPDSGYTGWCSQLRLRHRWVRALPAVGAIRS